MLQTEQQRIEELYARQPGLTCAAIAKATGVSEADVRRLLHYPPLPERFFQQCAPITEIENRPPVCSGCGSKKIFRHGRQRGTRVYRCYNCGKYYGITEQQLAAMT